MAVGNMGFRVYWYDETHRIIRFDADGKWHWDEFYPALDEVLHLLQSVTHPVDFIADLTQGGAIPPSVFVQARNMVTRITQQPNSGVSVYVGATPILQSIARALQQMSPDLMQKFKFDFAKTVTEAYEKIAALRHYHNPTQ